MACNCTGACRATGKCGGLEQFKGWPRVMIPPKPVSMSEADIRRLAKQVIREHYAVLLALKDR